MARSHKLHWILRKSCLVLLCSSHTRAVLLVLLSTLRPVSSLVPSATFFPSFCLVWFSFPLHMHVRFLFWLVTKIENFEQSDKSPLSSPQNIPHFPLNLSSRLFNTQNWRPPTTDHQSGGSSRGILVPFGNTIRCPIHSRHVSLQRLKPRRDARPASLKAQAENHVQAEGCDPCGRRRHETFTWRSLCLYSQGVLDISLTISPKFSQSQPTPSCPWMNIHCI